jgi:hypothetical protein
LFVVSILIIIDPKINQNDLAIVKVEKAFQKTNWVETISPLTDPHAYPPGINFDFLAIHILILIHIDNTFLTF